MEVLEKFLSFLKTTTLLPAQRQSTSMKKSRDFAPGHKDIIATTEL